MGSLQVVGGGAGGGGGGGGGGTAGNWPAKGYYSGIPDIISPGDPRVIAQSAAVMVANQSRLARVTCHRAGDLRYLSTFVLVSSGNMYLAVYDTGDASSGNRTLLWKSAATACGAANAWQTIDPGAGGCTVTAGQVVELVVVADNGTMQIARISSTNAGTNQLPSTMGLPPGGALPKMVGVASTTYPPPTTIAEASISANNTIPALIAQIV